MWPIFDQYNDEVCIHLHNGFGKTEAAAYLKDLKLRAQSLRSIAENFSAILDVVGSGGLIQPHVEVDYYREIVGHIGGAGLVYGNGSGVSGGGHETRSGDLVVDANLEAMKFVLASIVNPTLCAFGIIGNVFSVLVLTRRRMKASMDCTMEQAAHTSLIALAVSDMFYCLTTIFVALLSRSQSAFQEKTIILWVKLLGPGLQVRFEMSVYIREGYNWIIYTYEGIYRVDQKSNPYRFLLIFWAKVRIFEIRFQSLECISYVSIMTKFYQQHLNRTKVICHFFRSTL